MPVGYSFSDTKKVCARGSITSLYVSANNLGTLVVTVVVSLVAMTPVA